MLQAKGETAQTYPLVVICEFCAMQEGKPASNYFKDLANWQG